MSWRRKFEGRQPALACAALTKGQKESLAYVTGEGTSACAHLKRLEAVAVQESEGEEAAEQRVTLAEDLGRGNLAARQSRVRLQEACDPAPSS